MAPVLSAVGIGTPSTQEAPLAVRPSAFQLSRQMTLRGSLIACIPLMRTRNLPKWHSEGDIHKVGYLLEQWPII